MDGLGGSTLGATAAVIGSLTRRVHSIGSGALLLLLLASAVTFDDFKDQIFGDAHSLHATDEVDGTQTIDALGLAQDVNVAATAFLEIFDGLAAATDDEAHGLIRNHDLGTILAITESGQVHLCTARHASGVGTLILHDIGATILFNDGKDGGFGSVSTPRRPGNSALTLRGVRVLGLQKLHTSARLRLDLAKVLARATDDQTNKGRFHTDSLGISIALAPVRRVSRVAVTAIGRVGAAVATTSRVFTTLITVRVAIRVAPRWGARP